MGKSVIFVVDKKYSALWIAANSRLANFKGKILFANDFASPYSLAKEINKSEEELVIFSWRRSLLDIYASKSSRSIYKELKKSKKLIALIPDYLGLEDSSINDEIVTKICSYYLVTNFDLFNKYSSRFDIKPAGVLHDIPNLDLINETKLNYKRSIVKGDFIKLIWIGNSAWGKRLNKIDHKGFKELVLPLQKIIDEHGCGKLTIIDSARKAVPQQEIFKQIMFSDLLIQTSRSEGTGLPLLEAISIGTNVLTTNVGIAQEVLTDELVTHIAERNVESFHKKIHEIQGKNDQGKVHEAWLRYLMTAINEEIDYNVVDDSKRIENLNLRDRFNIKLYWLYRYLINIL